MAGNYVSAKAQQDAPVVDEGGFNCACCGKLNPYTHTDLGYWIGSRFFSQVFACKHCGAVQGEAGYAYEANMIVKDAWDDQNCAPEDQRYYDLVYTTSAGQRRMHGWFNPANRKITQTG